MKQLAIKLLICGFILSNFSCDLANNSSSSKETLSIEGEGVINVTPEIVKFSITLSALDKNYSISVSKLEAKTKKLYSALKKINIKEEDIKTSNLNIRKKNEYNSPLRKTVFVGFEVNHDIYIKLNLTEHIINKVLEAISEDLVEATFNIAFDVTDESKARIKKQLVEEAIIDAKGKADLIAKNAGINLKKVHQISYNQYTSPKPLHSNFTAREAVSFSRATFEDSPFQNPKQLTFREKISISWEIR